MNGVTIQQMLSPEADGVGDRCPDEIAQHAEHDHPEQGQLVAIDVEAGKQHRGLGARQTDHVGCPV